MDVPLSSSGAMSRAHYALVRKIETATPQAADQILLAEVQNIRHLLTRSTVTLKQCKEYLVLLLYCSMAVNPGVRVDLDFALPHAINLAEAGQTIQDKRIGYLFCAEVMPPEHELQLMLVNSIRKDLESTAVPRICLALDTLVQSPSRDVIPAIQSRLQDLLSHNSVHVKRRAFYAYDRLSEYDSDLTRAAVDKTQKRLQDGDSLTVSAALTLANNLVKGSHLSADKYHELVSRILNAVWAQRPDVAGTKLLNKTVQTVAELTPSTEDLQVLMEIIHYYARLGSSAYATILQCFRALAAAPTEHLSEVQSGRARPIIAEVRHLLTSSDPNGLYVFICCLSSVDPRLWAGTTPEIPAVLEEWEVERVMKLLECEDRMIRKQTIRTLWHVDQGIVEAYYARALQGDLPSSSTQGTEEVLPRLLEILDVICSDNVEAYAQQVKFVLKAVEGDGPLNRRIVVQEAVEEILTRVHAAESSWRSGWIGVLFTSVIDPDEEVGPTLMVILTALLCEYVELSPIAPLELMHGLSRRLSLYTMSVQDVCLITMLRIAAVVEDVPSDILSSINELHQHVGRHLRRRCDQFITLSKEKEILKRIVSSTRSSTLPDFVFALEKYEADQKRAPSRSPKITPYSPPLKPRTPEPSSSRSSPVPGKLRYTAYDPPKPTSPLRRMSSSSSSRHSDDGGSRAHSYQDPMSMTVTPGDLTIAAQTSDLRSIPSSSPRQTGLSPLPIVQILDEEPSQLAGADLIALDSPFMSEPVASSIASTISSVIEEDFATTWNSLEAGAARGWCESSIDTVLRKLQGLKRRLRVMERDRPPFEGDLKIIISLESADSSSKTGLAAVRLKESDDDSCLWWVRCEDEQLRNIIKATLR